MNSDQFGKDLGLMHELVVMGRKTGFERNEWERLAHSDKLMRATLNFVRSVDTAQFPPTMVESEKIVQLAKLTKMVLPYYRGCIDCGDFKGRANELGPKLLESYEGIGLVLADDEKRCLQHGSCHQPFSILSPFLKEVLGVELPDGKFTDILVSAAGYYQLNCFVTSATSLANVLALKEAAKEEGFSLRINLQFKEN